jgi:hypothetical protein
MNSRSVPAEIKTAIREPIIVELSTIEYFIFAHKEHALAKLSKPLAKKSRLVLSLMNICSIAILRCRLPIASLPIELRDVICKRSLSWYQNPHTQYMTHPIRSYYTIQGLSSLRDMGTVLGFATQHTDYSLIIPWVFRHLEISIDINQEIDKRLSKILCGYCPGIKLNKRIDHCPYV